MRIDPSPRPAPTGGFTVLELVVTLALLAVLALIGYPALLGATSAVRVELAARELAGTLRVARAYAVRYSANVGVKLYPLGDGGVEWRLHRDGNGNGVRSRDIERGHDPPLGPRRRLQHFGRGAFFGFPAEYVPRDPGRPSRPMGRLDDPIRFNRSDLASFDPLGASTPGSLYLTDGRNRLVAVRLYGRTGKIRILRYDPGRERWR